MDKNAYNRLVLGLKQGSQEAWLSLYDAYAAQLWQNVGRLMGSQAGAVADIVQESLMAAARSARTFDPKKGSVWAWLWTIARRQIALHYRKQRPQIHLNEAQQWFYSLNGEQVRLVRDLEAPWQILEARELRALVRHCLNDLSSEYQLILMAKYMDDLSVAQIASRLQSSPVAVRSKLARARTAFRQVFEKVIEVNPV